MDLPRQSSSPPSFSTRLTTTLGEGLTNQRVHTKKNNQLVRRSLLGLAAGLLLSSPAHAATLNPVSLSNGFWGGTLIGGAAGVTLLGAGEIMGFSGIISPLLQNPVKAWNDPNQQWKFAFLSTFLLSAFVFFLPVADMAKITSVASMTSPAAYILSGLLVGMGTRLGNGCTSGHGICGMARRSRRSISAVITFMSTAVLTTVLTSPQQPTGRYFAFLHSGAIETYLPTYIMASLTALLVSLFLGGLVRHSKDIKDSKWIPAALSGVLASAGLARSSMVYPASVFSFLNVTNLSSWDPTLMMVMGGGLLVSFLAYQLVPGHSIVPSVPKLEKPLVAEKFGVPTNRVVDAKLLVGAVLFGMGWGVTGVCPGPALLLTMTGLSGMILQWWPAFFVGTHLAEAIKARW